MKNKRVMSDAAVLDGIQALMSGVEWSAETLDGIAGLVRLSGRHVDDSGDYEVDA